MKSALFYGEKDIRVEDRRTPEPGPGEVLIGIKAAGVCGSDLHNYRGNRPSTLDAPWEQGHELAGVVEGIGPGVYNLTIGDRVGVEAEHLVGCGRCRECRRGDYHICPERGIINGARHGSHGFSSHDITLASNCFLLPNHVPYDHAAILDCYACGVHAVNRSPVPVDGTTVIVGAGAIALTLGQVAKAYGAGRIIMVGTRPEPLQTAVEAGAADEYIVNADEDPIQGVLDRTDGEGADVVFETVGGEAQLISQCTSMARRGGAVSVLGLFTQPQTFDSQAHGMAKELVLTWSNSYSSWRGVSEYETALDLLAGGRLNAAPIITHHFPQSQIAEAFAAADDKRSSGAIRVVVEH
ncbi:MAG: alcohol dehydrogenase catalytic domain-containing protein [Chloroflexi bacterium]|nr:alcohol dehydrogenase catalytic domain-containing protein [Chloroflexota bacterium]